VEKGVEDEGGVAPQVGLFLLLIRLVLWVRIKNVGVFRFISEGIPFCNHIERWIRLSYFEKN